MDSPIRKRILITSPELSTNDNVSGISSLVSNIIRYSSYKPQHLVLGSRDNQKKGAKWLVDQAGIFLKFGKASAGKKYDVLHLNTGLEVLSISRDYLIASIAKKIFKKKVLFHVHGGYFLMNEPQRQPIKFFLERLFSLADKVIVLSEKEKNLLVKRYSLKNISILPNAVNISSRPATKDVIGFDGRRNLKALFFGRINKSKGIYTITESFKYLNDYLPYIEFDIYGKGPELDNWLNKLSSCKGLRYEYKGVIDETEKPKVLADYDLFLLPSLHSEGLPMAMLEAMSAGCTVIVTDDASISSVVKNGKNGFIVSKNNPEALAAKIKQAVDNEIDLEEIGRNASATIKEKHSFDQYVQKLDSIYERM